MASAVKNRACPYCSSPARTNPCWWFIKHPEQSPSGGDPPCFGDAYDEDMNSRERRFGRNWLLLTALAVAIGAVVFFFVR